jgi:hypothetical protein
MSHWKTSMQKAVLWAVPLVTAACTALAIGVIASSAVAQERTPTSGSATGTTHIVDMTGQYIELQFLGNVFVQRTDELCIYRFPSLAVKLLPSTDVRFRRTSHIQRFRMIAVAPGLASEKRQLVEEKVPLSIELEQPDATGKAADIVFRVPKSIAEMAEYVAFNLGGRSTLHVHDDELAKTLGRTRDHQVAWPIAARSNILGRRQLADGSFRGVIRKTPTDPNDWCAPEKIR